MKSCLIVDDSRVVRMVARKILQDLAFECVEAEDGFCHHSEGVSPSPRLRRGEGRSVADINTC